MNGIDPVRRKDWESDWGPISINGKILVRAKHLRLKGMLINRVAQMLRPALIQILSDRKKDFLH